MCSTTHRTDATKRASTTDVQATIISLTDDERGLIHEEGVSVIASAGDEIAHAHRTERNVSEIEDAVIRVQLGIRLMHAADDGQLPATDAIRAQLVRSHTGTVSELAGDTDALERLDRDGVHGYVEHFSESTLRMMTAAELIREIEVTREQADKLARERDLFAAILGRWPEDGH